MRLLIVTQYFWPENFRINDLVSELIIRGHDVTILTGKPNYPDGKIFSDFIDRPGDFDCYKGAKIIRVPMLPRKVGNFSLILNYISFALSASTIGCWRLRNYKVDAIFAYEPSPITVGIPAVLLRSIKKAPLLFWVLDLWPETLEAIGVLRAKWGLNLIGKLVSCIYKHCDLILAQSKSFIPKITNYAGIDIPVVYFPGWAEAVFEIKKPMPAPEVLLDSKSFNIVFTGNIGEAQDFPSILSAAELLKNHKNIRWLIIGDGRQAAWLKNQIQVRGLQRSVLMLGLYPIDRMPSFFAHADALLVTLKDEPIFSMTIPGKLQTYLSAGIPILGMLNGEGADVISSGNAGLCCSAGDYKALADSILRLSSLLPEERLRIGLNASVVSEKQFSRKNLIDQLELWFDDVCSKVSR
ncbi:MAG: glycosyltransferase family 4 protein [Methylophilaceae bacterium]|nr:glycosyltransferase family 4 protein [Methylophilaceae bacterium]